MAIDLTNIDMSAALKRMLNGQTSDAAVMEKLNKIANDSKLGAKVKEEAQALYDKLTAEIRGNNELQVGDSYQSRDVGQEQDTKTPEQIAAEQKVAEAQRKAQEKIVVESVGEENLVETGKTYNTGNGSYNLYQEAYATGDRKYQRLFYVGNDGKLMELQNAKLEKDGLGRLDSNSPMEPKEVEDVEKLSALIVAKREWLNSPIPSVTFSKESAVKVFETAKQSAEIINKQVEALKTGLKLREDATRIDLDYFKRYTNKDTWKSEVNSYLNNTYKTYLNQVDGEVTGKNYDEKKETITDRVLGGDKLSEEIGKKDLQTVVNEMLAGTTENPIDEKYKINLSAVKIGKIPDPSDPEKTKDVTLDVLKLVNIKDSDNNKTIVEKGESMVKAAATLQVTIDFLEKDEGSPIKVIKRNIANIKKRIKECESNIESYQSAYKEIISQKTNDEERIKAAEDPNCKNKDILEQAKYAKYRKLLRNQQDNLVVVKGKDGGYTLDFSGMTVDRLDGEDDEAYQARLEKYKIQKNEGESDTEHKDRIEKLKQETETAYKELLKLPGSNLKETINKIGKMSSAITDEREYLVKSLKTLGKYEIALDQLKDMKKNLAEKGEQLRAVGRGLSAVEAFDVAADPIVNGGENEKGRSVKGMYVQEGQDLEDAMTKAKARMDEAATDTGTVETEMKSDVAREEDSKEDKKINEKVKSASSASTEKIVGGKKKSTKKKSFKTKNTTQDKKQTVIDNHDVANTYLNELRDKWNKYATRKAEKRDNRKFEAKTSKTK